MNRYSITNIIAILYIGLLLTAIPIIACAPAAPPAPQSAPPADTPTPPATWEPDPTPVILPAHDYPKLDEMLDLQVAVYQTRQSSVSGQTEPRSFEVYIWTHDPTQREEVTSFLDRHNITHIKPITYPGTRSKENDISATIPVSLLESLNAQPGVRGVELRERPYPALDGGLDELAAQYAAGLMPDQDTNPTFMMLDIGIDSKENFDSIMSFLKNNGGIMRYADSDADDLYAMATILTAFVPVALLEPLSKMPGVKYAVSFSDPVPERFRYTLPPIDSITPVLPTEPKPRSESPPYGNGATATGIAAVSSASQKEHNWI